ncbi:MAG TPA: LysR family transcriptional regulator [Sphingomonas sp.]|uniref:LysR family transcriptional regulator n=1 Tax=Sphingomonas sp. TaxID=28214 RepID=UPI002C1563F1|nr:LysR family transcriptional regulator [Sphingomonas sp.]HMI18462.1 LysR family transcriptional regulator [Sphingomonas sp.]
MELEAEVAIAKHGSFRAAAIDLDVAADSDWQRHIEYRDRLGVCLFNRTTRNVALTSAGREYVEAIAPALSDIASQRCRSL